MKFQNIFLLSLLAYKTAIATETDTESSDSEVEGNAILKYNFHCVNDNRHLCSILSRDLSSAVNSLSKVLDITSPINFEAFVDDVSNYREDTSKETLAVAMDSNFVPLNTKENIVSSPYPNAQLLISRLNNVDNYKEKDFILVLNNFKSDKEYLKTPQDDYKTLIIKEIFIGLKALNKLDFPYTNKTKYPGFETGEEFLKLMTINPMEIPNYYLSMRMDAKIIDNMALNNERRCEKIIELNKLPSVIHWKDTLISKGNEHFPKKKYEYKRIIALGDIHGDYNKLVNILRHAKLIDKKNNWIGTNSILVQVGDLTDRGSDFKKILDLLIKLREQATKKGGIVYMLLGNHELSDMQSSYFYISQSDYDAFGGYLNREKELSMEGKYGELLRNDMNVTMVVDDTLFAHAGLTYEYAKLGIDELNNHLHDVLSNAPSYDDLYYNYFSKGKSHVLFTDSLFDFLNGPLWTRIFAEESEEEACKELDKVLEITKTKRMIIGHTVQEYGHINTRCQNKLILIDIGLSHCIGDYFGYVEILNNKKEIWARYNN